MWTVLLFLNLGALHCTVSTSPPSPTNVIFSSVNLRNVLHWFPGSDTQDDTHFTVQYAIYGDTVEGSKGRRVQWRAAQWCSEIERYWCDLSNETWDLEQGYYARVRAVSQRASSKWALTRRRFDPKTDTSFGPPLVSVELKDNIANITLTGPMRHQPNNHTPAVSMATLYPRMTYNLSIDNTHYGKTHYFPVVSSSYKYRLMEYDTEYCFSAKARFFSMPLQCQSSSQHCITTPKDPVIGQLQRMVVGIVVPSVCMCMLVVVGYFLYRYLTGKGQKSPYILKLPAFHPPALMFPPENPNLILITIIKELPPESGISCPKWPRHVAHPLPGYASQRPATPPELEEPWDDSSVSYGFIGQAPKIDIRGEDENNLKGEHQTCNSYEKKEWRVKAGASSAQIERSTLIQAHAWSQPALLTQSQTPLLSFQGAAMGEVNGEEEDREFPALFLNTTPQPLQTKMDGEVRVRTDGGIEEGSESEKVLLLSAYASQNITNIPTSHTDQSDFLPSDYGVLRQAPAHEIEEDDEEEEEGTVCIDWDPQTGKLVLPEINNEGKSDGFMQGEKGGENRMGGEDKEEVNSMKGELRLENVFVRQGSEEKAEAQREMERGGEIGWEADDFMARWNLVISMDQ